MMATFFWLQEQGEHLTRSQALRLLRGPRNAGCWKLVLCCKLAWHELTGVEVVGGRGAHLSGKVLIT